MILKSLNNTLLKGFFNELISHYVILETLDRTEHYSKAAEILSITQLQLKLRYFYIESESGTALEKRGRKYCTDKIW